MFIQNCRNKSRETVLLSVSVGISLLLLVSATAGAGIKTDTGPFQKDGGDPCAQYINATLWEACIMGEMSSGGDSDHCARCTDCYQSAYDAYKMGLEGCNTLLAPPGCKAGVILAYENRKEFCSEMCSESNCTPPTIPSN